MHTTILLTFVIVLDPRIGYSGLVADYAGDSILLQEVDAVKDQLGQYFFTHYCAPPLQSNMPPLSSSSAALLSAPESPERVDFTAQNETLPIESVDEWEEFLTLKCESFKACDPIRVVKALSSRNPPSLLAIFS